MRSEKEIRAALAELVWIFERNSAERNACECVSCQKERAILDAVRYCLGESVPIFERLLTMIRDERIADSRMN